MSDQNTSKKLKKPKLVLPYKKMPLSKPVEENPEKATRKFAEGQMDGVGKYEMILTAAARARDLKNGNRPLVKTTARETVTALLEIEAGVVGWDYIKDKI
jgi:DNA-directed RNA polymerase omega subunit